MRLEDVVEAEADHYGISVVRPGTDLYNKVLRAAQQTLEVAQRFLVEPARTGEGDCSGLRQR